jgi:hypothetical protein
VFAVTDDRLLAPPLLLAATLLRAPLLQLLLL